jgi:hypothetical protein
MGAFLLSHEPQNINNILFLIYCFDLFFKLKLKN